MRVRLVVAAVLALGAGLTGAAGAAAGAAEARESRAHVDRVLIVSLPRVSWSDVADRDDVPHLKRLLDGSAVADLSVRAPSIRPDLAGGYATLSAGDKAVGSGTADDGAAFVVDEHVGAGTARQAFLRRTGTDASRGLVHLGLPQIVDANEATDFEAEVGALGDALDAAGYARAVIANGDGVELPSPAPESDDPADDASRRFRREAVTALMTSDGKVPAGQVSKDLLEDDPNAAFGVRLDVDLVIDAFDAVWTPKSVVLVEASDLVRADAYRDLVSSDQRAAVLGRALRASDALVGALMERVDPARDAVVLVGPAAPSGGSVLTIAAVRAPGLEPGLLRSGTTQRTGYVQLMDMGPTVLDLLGVPRPDSMRGRPVEVGDGGGSAADRRDFLVDGNEASTFRVRIVNPVPNVFIGLAAALAVATVLALWRPGLRRLRVVLPVCACVVLAYLPAVYLARLFPFHDVGAAAYWLFLLVGSIALGVSYRAVARGRDLDSVMIGLGVLVAVLVIDVVLGNPLQFNSALGFSPSVAGRFIGFGNAAYAALASAAILLAGLLAHRIGGRRGAWWGVGVMAVALAADGAPMWGADVGGVLSMVPAYGITAALLLGIRVRVRTVVAFVSAALVALAAVTVVDLQKVSGRRRHLGRLIEQIQDEGFSAFTDVVQRKISHNLDSLSTSSFRYLVVVGVAFVAYLLWWPPRQLVRLLERVPELRAALIGFGVLAVLGYGLNDAGVTVPGLMLGVLICTLVPLLVPRLVPSAAEELVRS
ncbi:MAG: hypothetical protein WD271_05380 [Acidimicrobiia bacterium]